MVAFSFIPGVNISIAIVLSVTIGIQLIWKGIQLIWKFIEICSLIEIFNFNKVKK